ncbi:hypothetical protein ACSYS8_000315 [Stenotrophomonas muris]|uniref:hypothetical protein n=1 Tax=Stenotrophomonas muris TaxID=2963283 RepID=UPI0039C74420
MQSRNICLDFKSVFSPYLLASALAARAQGQIGKIYAPSTVQYFEVWSKSLARPVTFRLESAEEGDALLEFSRNYGFNSVNVEAQDVFSSLYILHAALRDGHVELIDTSAAQVKVTKENMNGQVFSDFYEITSPLERINICPDMAGATLEGMIGLSIENKFKPVFGDHAFLNYFATAAHNIKVGKLVSQPPSNKILSDVIDLRIPLAAKDLYAYSSDPKFFSIIKQIGDRSFAAGASESGAKNVIVDGLSMTVDALVGAPITSVPKLAYDAFRATVRKSAI